MIEVTVDTVSLTSGSLHLGCVVKGPEGSWVRFAVATVPLSLFDYATIQSIVQEHDREVSRERNQPGLF